MSESKALVKVDQQLEALNQRLNDQNHLQLIRDSYFKGCDDLEFQFAIETCRHLGLDPIAKQIYFLKVYDKNLRREVVVPVVSIDGLRLGAERSGLYAGQTPPEWCGPDGVWRDVWLGKGPPSAARVGVLRKDFDAPVYGVCRYESFVRTKRDGGPSGWWATAPEHMLAKCAEAQALKKCMPRELSAATKVQDVDLREPEDRPTFRVRSDKALPDVDVDEAIIAVRAARTMAELDKATQRLKGIDLDQAQREDARDAWIDASKRLAAELRTQSEPQPESHDYGPPPLEPEELAAVGESFGFDGKEEN